MILNLGYICLSRTSILSLWGFLKSQIPGKTRKVRDVGTATNRPGGLVQTDINWVQFV